MRLAALAVVGAGIFALQGCFEADYRHPGYGPYAYSDAPSGYYYGPPSRTYIYRDHDDDRGWHRGWHHPNWFARHEYRHREHDWDHDRD
jgi:hypothetical protein